MIVEFLFSRHDTCKLLCDTSRTFARSSPTRRYTGNVAMRMSYDRFSLISKSLKYSLVVKIRKKPDVSLYSLYQGRDLK